MEEMFFILYNAFKQAVELQPFVIISPVKCNEFTLYHIVRGKEIFKTQYKLSSGAVIVRNCRTDSKMVCYRVNYLMKHIDHVINSKFTAPFVRGVFINAKEIIENREVSKMDFVNKFQKLFSVATPIPFNPEWENGTGYFDHACHDETIEDDLSCFVDGNGRRGIILKLKDGSNAVIFERYAADRYRHQSNVPMNIRKEIGNDFVGFFDEDKFNQLKPYFKAEV